MNKPGTPLSPSGPNVNTSAPLPSLAPRATPPTVISPSPTIRSMDALASQIHELETRTATAEARTQSYRDLAETYEKRLIELQSRFDFLDQHTTLLSAKHDHTSAFATSLLTRLITIQTLITESIREAREGANKGRSSPLTPEEESQLSELATLFGANNRKDPL